MIAEEVTLKLVLPEYHRWKQDEFCYILRAAQMHCGLQNLRTEKYGRVH